MRFETPFLWFTTQVNGGVRVWDVVQVDGLMVNAYEILQADHIARNVRGMGVHRYLGYDGLIIMDSGGYHFSKTKDVDAKVESLLLLYEKSRPDLAVVLDHPIAPNLPVDEAKRRIEKTLEYTRVMVERRRFDLPELVPAIHGYDEQTLRYVIDSINKIGDFDVYAVGSLVSWQAQSMWGQGIVEVARIVALAKSMLYNKILHAFGVAKTHTTPILFYAGADSLDTISWIMQAVYGKIHLPASGGIDFSVRATQGRRPKLNPREARLLEECDCPVCRRHGWEVLRVDSKARAMHNAWVYQKEMNHIRELMKTGEFERWVWRLYGRHPVYREALRVADKIRRKV